MFTVLIFGLICAASLTVLPCKTRYLLTYDQGSTYSVKLIFSGQKRYASLLISVFTFYHTVWNVSSKFQNRIFNGHTCLGFPESKNTIFTLCVWKKCKGN